MSNGPDLQKNDVALSLDKPWKCIVIWRKKYLLVTTVDARRSSL